MPQETYEDIKDDVKEEKVDKKVEQDFVEDNADELEAADEPSEAEKSAMAKGWKPEGVEGKPNLSAEEFLRNEEFFNKIHKQNKTIKNLEKQLDEMAGQHAKLAELERKKVLDELNAQKKKALAEEDYDRVVELDERLAETREEKVETKQPKQEDHTIDPDFYTWQARNSWYDQEKNPDLFQEATALGAAYANMTGTTGTELYEHVEATMKRLYPDRLGSGAKNPTAAVETTAKPVRKKAGPRKYTKADLNDTQRQVMNRYVRSGVMTESEYIDELAKIGELG